MDITRKSVGAREVAEKKTCLNVLFLILKGYWPV